VKDHDEETTVGYQVPQSLNNLVAAYAPHEQCSCWEGGVFLGAPRIAPRTSSHPGRLGDPNPEHDRDVNWNPTALTERLIGGTDIVGNRPVHILFWSAVGAAAIVLVFGLEGRVGFNLADESFLWYGTQRVLSGEVPIRDFMAYDPGRYYWSAAFMYLVGDYGIVSLRVSVAVFQSIGLMLAMLLLLRAPPRAPLVFYLLAGATLLLWMYPRHKLFDITIAICLIAGLAHLVVRPTLARYFLMGLLVGAVAIFGRNHGVYGAVASLAAMGVLSWKRIGPPLVNALSTFSAGVLIGFSPILIACLLVPGFFRAFLDDVLFLFEIGSTNLTLPVPWPWEAVGLPWPEVLQHVLLGSFFVMALVFAIAGPAYVLISGLGPANATFAAAAFLALPYAHFVFSRADAPHLAQGIFPLIIGLMSAPCMRTGGRRAALAALLLTASLPVGLPQHPSWTAWRNGEWRSAQIGHDRLVVSPDTAANVNLLTELVANDAPDGKAILSLPFWTAPYAIFNRKAPNQELYPLFPQSRAYQEQEIARIRAADPALVILDDSALDDQEERRYRNTHPLIYRYIIENFERVDDPKLPPEIEILVSRGSSAHR
jgi:hypothetical protein